jgi:hypothetical protein
MSGEKYVDPFKDPNDQNALAAATNEIDEAGTYMQAEGYSSDAPPEDMIDKRYIENALRGDSPPVAEDNDND